MRLLNTATLELEEFEDAESESYAILSHRWGNDEVSYQDYLDGKRRTGHGYHKIIEFCQLAKANGFEWGWVDTCCIDKKSSAELSEAVNSMYSWYKESAVCYIYLVDVPPASVSTEQERTQSFQSSEWWERGWTLQELLAPEFAEFYDSSWSKIGEKEDLTNIITDITGIGSAYLLQYDANDPNTSGVKHTSIATRMSWASQRETTRPEDMAYCLLGLFGVNMPLLYGEGARKAFVRLQFEIIKKSDDESIFAWSEYSCSRVDGLLASRPAAFARSAHVSPIFLDKPIFEQKPFSMTNRGLKIRYPSIAATPGHRYVLFHCCAGNCEECSVLSDVDGRVQKPYIHRWLALRLRKVSNDQWRRDSTELFEMDPRLFTTTPKAMYVIQDFL